MDSLDYENLQNIRVSQGSLILSQTFNENEDGEYNELEYLNDSSLSINKDTGNQIFIGPDSEVDDPKFFAVCAENKVNALIERVRDFHENFGRPDEFENEAVAMAIQQHGLRKNNSEDVFIDSGEGGSPQNFNISKVCMSAFGLVPDISNEIENKKCKKNKQPIDSSFFENDGGGISNENHKFDDIYFINEAVAAAIEQKGLSSSSFSVYN